MTRHEPSTCQSQRQPRYLRKMQSPGFEYVVRRPRYSSPPPSYSMSQHQQKQQQQQEQVYALHRASSISSLPPSPSLSPPVRQRRRASVVPPDWSYQRPRHGFSGRLPPSPPPSAPMPPRRARPVKRRKSCPDLWNAVEQVVELVDATACEVEQHMRTCMAHGEDIYGMVERTLDEVITLIDEGRYTRDELGEFLLFLLLLHANLYS